MQDIRENASKKLKNVGPVFIMAAAFLWTLDAVIREGLTYEFESLQIVFFEHLIIILVILPWLIKYLPDLRKFTPKEWGSLIFIGFGGSALATVALTEAYSLGFITMAVLLQQTQPFIAIGLAYFLLNERLPKEYFILAFFAIFGVFLIFFPFLTNFTEDPAQIFVFTDISFLIDNALGGILALIAAFFWGGSTVFGRLLLEHSEKRLEYKPMITYRFFTAFLFLFALNIALIIFGTDFPGITTIFENILPLFFLALIVGLLSLGLYYFGLKNTHATISTVCELFYPLSAFVLLPILLSEYIYFSQILGSLLLVVVSGILSYRYSKFVDTKSTSKESFSETSPSHVV